MVHETRVYPDGTTATGPAPLPSRSPSKHPFEYQKPTPDQVARMGVVNEALKLAYEQILALAPESRERSLAITNLQQSRMWTNAAIVLAEV